MAAYENRISILIVAQDQASAIVSESAAKTVEAQDAVKASNDEVAASADRAAAATTASSREMAAAVDESAAQMEISNATTIAGFNAMAASADEKLTTGVGIAAAGVAAAVVVAVAAMVKGAGNFQASMTRLATSAGETYSQLGLISNGVLQIARDTGTSTSELAQALYMIESGGQHGTAGLATLKAAAEGAKTENADLVTVADAVTSAMTDYHYRASQAADVTSKLVAATGQGKTTFQDLSGAMSAILPRASAAGITLNEILGDLASMTLHGISAQQASENLADAVQHMQNPTHQQGLEFAALGLTIQQVQQSLGSKGLYGTIQMISAAVQQQTGTSGVILQLSNALKDLPPAVQQVSQEVLNGTATWTDWNKATKDLPVTQRAQAQSFATLVNGFHTVGNAQMSGAEAYQTYAGALAKAMGDSAGLNVALMLTGQNSQNTSNAIKAVSGATADASGNVKGWSEIQQNFNQQMSVLKEDVLTTGIALGESLLPPLTTFARVVGNLLSPLADFIDHHRKLAAAALLAVGALSAYIAISWAATAAWGALSGAVVEIGNAIIGLGADFYALQVAIGPVGWAIEAAILAVAAAAYFIVRNWTTVKEWLSRFWDDLKRDATDAADFLARVWDNRGDELRAIGRTIADGIGRSLSDGKQWAVDIGRGVATGVKDAIRNAPQWGRDIIDALERAAIALGGYDISSIIRWGDDLDSIYQRGLAGAKSLVKGLADGLIQGGRDAVQWGHDLITDVRLGFDQGVRDAKQWTKDIVTGISNGFTNSYQAAVSWGRAIIENVTHGLSQGVKGIGDFFRQLPSRIASDLKSTGTGVADGITTSTGSGFKDVGRMKRLGDDILKGLAIAILAVLGGLALLAVSIGIAIINGIINGIKGAVHLLSEAIGALWGGISWGFDRLGSNIVQWAKDVVHDVVAVFKEIGGALKEAIAVAVPGGGFLEGVAHVLHVPGFATGTISAPGGLAVVGENGPELVNLPQGSQVLTAAETRATLSAGGGNRSLVINNLNVYNNQDVGLVVRQIGWQLATAA
jgi:hypothetical protein